MVDLYSQTKLVIIPIRRKQGSTPTTGKRDRSRLERSDESEFHLILKDQELKDLKRTTRPEHDPHCSRKRVLPDSIPPGDDSAVDVLKTSEKWTGPDWWDPHFGFRSMKRWRLEFILLLLNLTLLPLYLRLSDFSFLCKQLRSSEQVEVPKKLLDPVEFPSAT